MEGYHRLQAEANLKSLKRQQLLRQVGTFVQTVIYSPPYLSIQRARLLGEEPVFGQSTYPTTQGTLKLVVWTLLINLKKGTVKGHL